MHCQAIGDPTPTHLTQLLSYLTPLSPILLSYVQLHHTQLHPTQLHLISPYLTHPNACLQEGSAELRSKQGQQEDEGNEETEVEEEEEEEEEEEAEVGGADEGQLAAEAELDPSVPKTNVDDATVDNFTDDSAPASSRTDPAAASSGSDSQSREGLVEEGEILLKKIAHCSLEEFGTADCQKEAVKKVVHCWMQVSHVPFNTLLKLDCCFAAVWLCCT